MENAVSHGLEPKQGSGKVQVILYEQNKRLHIIVEDDGVGFEEEDMETVREKEGHIPDWKIQSDFFIFYMEKTTHGR